jgi:hypothetical protein
LAQLSPSFCLTILKPCKGELTARKAIISQLYCDSF